MALVMAAGCNLGGAQKTAPAQKGQRGESCAARNDCEKELACIRGVCSKNDFDIEVSAKQCDRIDCSETADCCGNRPSEAPPKCNDRALICQSSSLDNCVPFGCTDSSECGDGSCGSGSCTNTFTTCEADADCLDTCVSGICSFSFFSCVTDDDCSGTCQGRSCDCDNPLFDPFDPICSDPDCEDICTLKCEEERCVVDDSCSGDSECPFGAPICEAGSCVQCLEDDDCDSGEGETCRKGRCERPCMADEECPLFHSCKDGECVETGCSSDRECVLAAGEGPEDARLSRCLPSDIDPEISVCKVPCENDGACASQFQVCDEGFCKFIGCESDDECRGFLGLSNQTVDDFQPFVSKAVCR